MLASLLDRRQWPGAFVDPACPVNWAHPLNYKRVSWHKVIPNAGWGGGLSVRDLCRGGRRPRDLTLQGFTTPQKAWRGFAPPGGYGSLSLASASSQYASSTVVPMTAVPITFNCWFNPTDVTTSQILMSLSNSASSAAYFQLYIATSHVWVEVSNTTAINSFTTIAPKVNTWQMGTATFGAGVLVQAFINAMNKTSASGGQTPAGINEFDVGAQNLSGTSQFFNGLIDGASVWNRVLSDNDLSAVYLDDQVGNPETLNWLTTRVYSFPALSPIVSQVPYDIPHSPQHQAIMAM